jgi:hypothetical protein
MIVTHYSQNPLYEKMARDPQDNDVKTVKLPAKSPNLGDAERFVLSIK